MSIPREGEGSWEVKRRGGILHHTKTVQPSASHLMVGFATLFLHLFISLRLHLFAISYKLSPVCVCVAVSSFQRSSFFLFFFNFLAPRVSWKSSVAASCVISPLPCV